MSLLHSMLQGKVFDSYSDILDSIKKIEEEDDVYLRRGLTQSIKSYNNRKDVSV
jgi:hypothetical protein